jgi:serine/threonine-protein kinase
MAPETESVLSAAEVHQELGKILSSSAFARPHRLCRLLKHLVERTLSGEQDLLKETLLGMQVFDRGPDFDPRTDPIVRIDARRLRARLAQYYADEGAANPFRIVIDPGSYVPSFRKRDAADPATFNLPSLKGHSVAVLPFANLSDHADYELFCEGLSEDILNRLAQQKGLRVIARTSAFQFRDPTRDPQQIAKQLRVKTLVIGSLRGDKRQLRITAQLVSAEDASILWSQEYDQPAEEMLEVQERISREIAAKFQGMPQMGENVLPGHRSGNSAYQLFLQGRRLLHQGTREGYLQGIDALEAAVKKDPAFAVAWANLSIACAGSLMFRLRNPGPMVARARLAAQKVLELDPLSPEAHTALGFIAALADFDWTEAGRWFESALQANPLFGFARLGRAMLHLAPTGQLDEAEDELERLLSNDPLNTETLVNLGRVFYFERRFEMAAELLQAVLDNYPKHEHAWIMLAFVREQMGAKQEALAAYHQWGRLISSPFVTMWTKAVEQVLLGNHHAAERTTRKLVWMARLAPFPVSGMVADLFLRLGDHDHTFEWLEKSYDERAIRLICAAVEPAFDPLRKDPRFQRLLARITGDAPRIEMKDAERQQSSSDSPKVKSMP